MFVTNGEERGNSAKILAFMPSSLRKYMYRINFDEATEIRMSLGKPVMFYYSDGCYYLNSTGVLTKSQKGSVRVSRAIIDEALEIASKSSLYTKQQSIKRGYITIDGGHRIGLVGSAVFDGDKLSFLSNISTLNYRLASEVKGVAKKVFEHIHKGDTKNTLIISPPGAGKTTMMRDIIRMLSDEGERISVVDERSELAAMNNGISAFDLGNGTDILDGVPKALGMEMVLRSMSPTVIAVDEIGTSEDIEAIKNCINSGVKIICTIHGYNTEDIKNRKSMEELLKFFDVFLVLSRDTKTMEFECRVEENK